MKVESKYNIGDEVVAIHRHSVELPPVPCSACEATGRCDLKGESFHCPKCNGKKTTQAQGYGWVIRDYGVILSVEIRTRSIKDDPSDRDEWDQRPEEVRYMFNDERCGSIYGEHSLWPDRDAALVECDRRNGYEKR